MDCLLSLTDFTWYILEYLDPYNVEICGDDLQKNSISSETKISFEIC